jgi:hypothetical protein
LIVFTLILGIRAFLALASYLVASCAGLGPIAQSRLVGEWRYADKTQGCHYIFNRDGSFTGDVVDHGKLISRFAGRWSVDADTINYIYLGDAFEKIPVGATDRDKLINVQSESFTIQAADGSRRKYLRVH